MLTGHGLDRIDFGQHFAGDTDDFLPCRCDLRQVFSAAGEDLNPELIFQHSTCLLIPGCDVYRPSAVELTFRL